MSCEWVSNPSGLVIQGYEIKRGFFYTGEAFPVYNKRRLCNPVGKKKNILLVKEPVIDPTLPIESSKTRKKAVVSYAQMDSYQRCLYLKWLAGENDITNTPEAIIAHYIWVISVRVFCDEECTKSEVDIIFEHLISLKSECEQKHWKYKSDVIKKIILLLSYICLKYYPELVQQYIAFEHVRQYVAIKQLSSSNIENIEDAYDIWEECFLKNKQTDKISEETKKEWWNIACNKVKSSNSGIPLFPTILKFNLKEYELDSCFSSMCPYLDYTIAQYSRKDAMLYTLLYRCDNEFQICHRRYRAGLDPNRTRSSIPANAKPRPKPKRKTEPSKVNRTASTTSISDVNIKKSTNEAVISTLTETAVIAMHKGVKFLQDKLSSDFQFISIEEMMNAIGYAKNNQIVIMSNIKALYHGLLSEGLGMAPSPSFLNRSFQFDDKVVIFRRLPDEKYEPDYLYDFTDVFLKLAAYISQGSITDKERSFVINFIKNKDTRIGNQKQLYAYFLWYLRNIKSITSEIKQCVKNDLNTKGREAIARHLVEYIEADLDTMFAKEHLLSNVLSILTSKPFTISDARRNEALVSIDLTKLVKIEQDTQVAQSLLSDIFADDEEPVVVAVSSGFEHADILTEILSKHVWKRSELSDLCKKNGYILGSLLEKINDYSYSKVDDAIIEDEGDVLYVNVEYKKVLL